MTQPTNTQKLDQILKVVTNLSTKHDRLETKVDGLETKLEGLETKVDGLETKIDRIESNTKEIIETLADAVLLTGKTADRVTKLENAQPHSFTPFTSGAFVA
ncbi:MAG: hypothetical protein V1487_02995 [bacterium]